MGKREEVILQKIIRPCFGKCLDIEVKEPYVIPEQCDDCPLDTYLKCIIESYEGKDRRVKRKIRRNAYGAFKERI